MIKKYIKNFIFNFILRLNLNYIYIYKSMFELLFLFIYLNKLIIYSLYMSHIYPLSASCSPPQPLPSNSCKFIAF